MSKQPDSQNNLIIAIVLSLGIMLAWQYFVAGPRMKEEQARQQREHLEQTQGGRPPGAPTAVPGESGTPAAPAKPGEAPPAPAGAPATPAVTRAEALKPSPRVAIATPSLKGSIALKGGRVDDISFVKYHETVDAKSPNVDLLSPSGSPEPYFAEVGWVAAAGAGVKVPDRDSLWRIESGTTLTPETPVTLAWDDGQGLVFHRTISVDSKYMFKIADEVENRTGGDVQLYPYGRVYRGHMPQTQAYYILHEGLIGFIGDTLRELTYASAQKAGSDLSFDKAEGGWLGITDKYWATALIPEQSAKYSARLFSPTHKTATTGESFQAEYRLDGITVAKGERRSIETRLFAGAKEVKTLNAYQTDLGIKQLSYLIDWGWFYFITKPLFGIMEYINALVHNFGITILLLTLLVKGAFFPLANKSYESMAKMKKLQPKMEEMKVRFKDDKARQQQELMALYQKEKINPLAGCLPILLQIPVFFALYKVLFVTIDMRHAPFFGWIKDLSAPDPTTIFNLFGLLPFDVPAFLHIGAWAVLMGITMWLQMQLNPQQPDPIQQQVFNWMPVMFTFLLASFPAGLVIYWAWNNLLSIIQQAYIMKKQGADIPLKDNIKSKLRFLFGGKPDAKS